MLITIDSFNGHDINSTSYEAVLLNPHSSTSADTVFIDQSEADPQDAGSYTVNKQTKVLSIRVKNYATRHALIAQLKTWFKRGTRGPLIGTFSDDGISYQLDCRVTSLIPDPEHIDHWTAMLETGNTPWRSVDEIVESVWTVSGTSEDLAIDVGGKDETYLSMTLTTDTLPSVGYLFNDRYQLPNKPGIERGMIAWCIEMDTAALILAGKMQSGCEDLRVVNQDSGQELKRWIPNPNDAATKIWVNLDMKMGFSLVLGTLVANTGIPAYLQYEVNATSKDKIAKMEKAGIVYHGNEWFSYTNTDSVNCRLTLGARQIYGTSIESHAAGTTFTYIQFPLVVKYGNATADDPASLDANYDDTKPLINLTDSTNDLWVWDATSLFNDPDHPNRTCAWKFSVKALSAYSKYYHVENDAETGDPALGLLASNYPRNRSWSPDPVIVTATFYSGANINEVVDITGNKYQSTGGIWTGSVLAALRRSVDGVNYFNLFTESAPSSPATWDPWTHSAVAVATGTKHLQLILSCNIQSSATQRYAALEALTCSIEYVSADIPTGTFLSNEEDSFPLNIVVANITDADYADLFTLDFTMLLNKDFVINGETRLVTYDGVNAYGGLTPDDQSRSVFIRLKGNATNTIRITGEDMGGLSVILSYYLRRQ